VIERLTKRGLFVARRLVERFALPPQSPAALSWDSHRWTRYRAAVAALSEQLTRFDVGYKATADELNGPPYRTLSDRGDDDPPGAYRWKRNQQRDLGNAFADALAAAAQVLDDGQPQSLREGAPRPEPEARIVPRG